MKNVLIILVMLLTLFQTSTAFASPIFASIQPGPVPRHENVTVQQNEDFNQLILLTDNLGNPINLTGCRIRTQIRAAKSLTSTVFATMDSANNDGSATITAAAGKVQLYLPASVTAPLTWTGTAWYDIKIYWADGTTTRIAEGNAFLDLGVTNE